jgi:hypothetical protein
LAVLAGCGTATAGKPVATDPPGPSRSSAPSTSESPDYSLARLCELLSPQETESLGAAGAGEEGNSISDGHAQCTWTGDTSLVVGVQPGLTTKSAPAGPGITNKPTTVQGLHAVESRQTDPIVTCQLLVDLPGGNLFGTSAALLTGGEGKYEPCTLASEMADIVVPRVKDH